MSGEDHIEELVAPYVLGALEPDELEQVELHLLWCEECRRLVEEERRVVGFLPYLAEPVPVPLRARRQLLTRVRAGQDAADELAPRRRVPTLIARLGWFAAASTAAIALVFAWNNSQMQAQVDKKDSQVAVLQQQQQNVMEFVSSRGGFTEDVQGTGNASNARGGVFLDPTRNAALLMLEGLPAPKQGTNYVVWMVQGSRHVNAGPLAVDSQGRGQLYITMGEPLLSFDRIAITEEVSPTASNPSGSPVVTARVGN